jgi:molecular chaperone Hsp33
MSDKWVKCTARGGNLKATAISAAELIEDARKRHRLGPAETIALGEALMAGLLLASTCKAGERVSLSAKGDGFLKQAVVDANPTGSVRGFVISRDVVNPTDSKLGPWQKGLLSIVRLKLDQKEPYTGTVPNITGHLPKDLTFYLTQSEQIPSAVGLAVNLDKKGHVKSAGAFLVQVMPGAERGEILFVENNIQDLQSLAMQMEKDSDPTRLLGQIFNELSFTILEEKPLQFECNCSKDRVARALKLLGKAELEDMLAKDSGAEIRCDFCGTNFVFDKTELEVLIARMY